VNGLLFKFFPLTFTEVEFSQHRNRYDGFDAQDIFLHSLGFIYLFLDTPVRT